MKIQRNIGLGLVVVLTLAALTWGFWPRPVMVEAGRVQRGPMSVSVEEEGMTRVKDSFSISAPVAGFLQRIRLEVGDRLEAGQTVAMLEPLRAEVLDPRSRARAEAQIAAAQAALQAAEETVNAARAEAEYARTDYLRKKKLRSDALVSQEALDQAETRNRQAIAEQRSARFAVEVVRFELEAARTSLEYSIADTHESAPLGVELKSPVASRVLQIYHKSEGVVTTGEALLEIGDPAALEIAVDVLSEDAVRIRPGNPVRLIRWGGEMELEGVVRVVEPAGFTKISALGVEEQRVWVIADLTSPREQWQSLGSGYRVEARFILWQDQDILQFPASALFRQTGKWAVYTINGGRARLQAVEIGHRTGLTAEVLTGLVEGDLVITHPDDRINEGVRVELQAQPD